MGQHRQEFTDVTVFDQLVAQRLVVMH
ncbi:MAG: hypothetical protein QOF68_2896, partial [Gaiellales bacterium]|nr:hypothetical protein [Gaiellales bacterium]